MASRSPTPASTGKPPSRFSTASPPQSACDAARPNSPPVKLAIVGVGLIGGSIGLAARERLDATVTGFDRDGDALASALKRGALDHAAASIEEALVEAEAAFVAVPVGPLQTAIGS